MNDSHSDALVFFGATGDLAYKKIFPALQAMVKRGHLNVPVIGVAKAGWNLDQLRARARDSLEKHGEINPAAFDKLCGLLHYVDGDYKDSATFQSLRNELGSAQHPAHYLAIPPVLFATVVEQLAKANCTNGARVIVEKPFGHDLTSAQELNHILLSTFDEEHIFRIDHYLGKRPVRNMPSWDIFEHQPQQYQDEVLPPQVTARVAVEQASTFGWERYIGRSGRMIGMKTFGASAPLKELQRKFGFEPDHVVTAAKEVLGRN